MAHQGGGLGCPSAVDVLCGHWGQGGVGLAARRTLFSLATAGFPPTRSESGECWILDVDLLAGGRQSQLFTFSSAPCIRELPPSARGGGAPAGQGQALYPPFGGSPPCGPLYLNPGGGGRLARWPGGWAAWGSSRWLGGPSRPLPLGSLNR